MSGAVVPRTSLELEENAAAFLGGGYFLRFKIPKTTVASSIRSVSTSIVVMRVTPLMQGNNLAVPYQQLHYSIHGFILSINRSSGRFLCIYPVFQSHKPKTGTPLGVPVFRILLSILRPAVSYHRISRSDIVLAAMMTIQQTSGLPARTTARTAAGTARAETDDTALAYPRATSVV